MRPAFAFAVAGSGVQLGTIDALLAQLCLRHRWRLLTSDRGFRHAAKHCALDLWALGAERVAVPVEPRDYFTTFSCGRRGAPSSAGVGRLGGSGPKSCSENTMPSPVSRA